MSCGFFVSAELTAEGASKLSQWLEFIRSS